MQPEELIVMQGFFFLLIFVFMNMQLYSAQGLQPMPLPNAQVAKSQPGKAATGIQSEIGAVDPMRVLEGSLEYREGIEHIEKELEARKNELQNLEQQITKKRSEFETAAPTLNEAGRKERIDTITELQIKYQSRMQTAQQYAQGAEEDLRSKVLRKTQKVVADIAKERGLKIVFAGGILYADELLDITQEVVTRLNKEYEQEKKKKKPELPKKPAQEASLPADKL